MLNRKTLSATLLALSLLGLSGTASAMDVNAQNLKAQQVLTQIDAGSIAEPNAQHLKTSPKPLNLYEMEYMRTTYKDLNFKLLGPIRFGVSDELIEHRFENLDPNYGTRLSNTNYTAHYDSTVYSQATAAKTTLNFKF